MSDCIQPTVSGYNEQIQMLKKLEEKNPEQQIFVSLLMFNNEFFPMYHNLKPSEISEMTLNDFLPDGMTALYDAIGSSVSNLEYRIKREIENDEASAVVVIITDGHENSSREYTFKAIASLIKRLESTDRWTFSYLGATLDAVDIAVSLNIDRRNSYAYSKAKTQSVFHDLSESMEDYIDQKKMGNIKKQFLK